MRRTLTALCLSAALGLTALPAHAAEGPVTPLAPTVTDECGVASDRVGIPQVEGVRYLVDIDGMTVELTPGGYAGIAFMTEEDIDEVFASDDVDLSLPDARATIRAEALDGYTLADGATTSFDVTLSSAPCASDTTPVTATTDCGSITFANPAGNPEVTVLWGGEDDDEPAELTLAPGERATVRTDAPEVLWFATTMITWEEETDWETRGATTPDVVATQQDREDLAEVAELLDQMTADDLGGGFLALSQDCATSTPSTSTPEIPAVVQTDGAVVDRAPVVPLGLLGGLLLLGASGAGRVVISRR